MSVYIFGKTFLLGVAVLNLRDSCFLSPNSTAAEVIVGRVLEGELVAPLSFISSFFILVEVYGGFSSIFLMFLLIFCHGAVFCGIDLIKGKKHRGTDQLFCTPERLHILAYVLTPVFIFDIFFVMTMATVANVYLFAIASLDYCQFAYFGLSVRLLVYCLAFAVPTVFVYIHKHGDDCDPLSFLLALLPVVIFGLKLVTISSSLTTFFTVAFSESLPVRYSYSVFTAIIVITAFIVACTQVVLFILSICDKNDIDCCRKFSHCFAHVVFLIDIVSGIGLIVLNAYILSTTQLDDSRRLKSIEVTLILTCVFFVLNFKHILIAEFCNHGPLGELLLLKCFRRLDWNCCNGLKTKLEKRKEERKNNRLDYNCCGLKNYLEEKMDERSKDISN